MPPGFKEGKVDPPLGGECQCYIGRCYIARRTSGMRELLVSLSLEAGLSELMSFGIGVLENCH